jgi:hydrogenase nickel incorporation protein HypA/HybF
VHELSVCQALLGQVAEIAMGRGAREVERITVEVGPLSGIEPLLLASAFAVMRAGSCAANAALLIESTAVTIHCLSCGAQSHTQPNRLVCVQCGGFRARITAGDELRLRRVELRAPQPRSASDFEYQRERTPCVKLVAAPSIRKMTHQAR